MRKYSTLKTVTVEVAVEKRKKHTTCQKRTHVAHSSHVPQSPLDTGIIQGIYARVRKPSTNLTLSSVARRLAKELIEVGNFSTRTALVEYLLRREYERVFGEQKAIAAWHEEAKAASASTHVEQKEPPQIVTPHVQKLDGPRQFKRKT